MTLTSDSLLFHGVLMAVLALSNLASCDRDQVNCFYCAPDSSNNLCTSIDKVTQQIDCPSGRCLVLGARLASSGKVARFFTCDTHNIVDWAFQILRYPADKVDSNNCGWLEAADDEAITMLREYGMQSDMQTLLQGTLPSSGAAVSTVANSMEICTCEGKLCNSPDAQMKWTLLPTSSDGQSLQSRASISSNYFNNKKERLTSRIGFDEKERERMDNYMNNIPGEKNPPQHMDNEHHRGHEGQLHPHNYIPAKLVEARAGNAPHDAGGFFDGWWYWVAIVISILLVLGALYLLYRVASAPTYATSSYDQTTTQHTHVESVPLHGRS